MKTKVELEEYLDTKVFVSAQSMLENTLYYKVRHGEGDVEDPDYARDIIYIRFGSEVIIMANAGCGQYVHHISINEPFNVSDERFFRCPPGLKISVTFTQE